MKLMKYEVMCLGLLLLLASCDASNPTDNEFSSLDGNDFVLKVDRISQHPPVGLPTENLKESDYEDSNEGTQYNITFSENGQRVTIGPGPIRGQKTTDADQSRLFELDDGLFAGGRFVVWINNDRFEAELTIYGSGVPIIKSERGSLVPER